ncbi:hypothetical protein B0H14DRAFT_3092781 [Mycena olivaceomarginata]|nr:hypothetical protein B0H14DRAFT_3092781 [Mycena olivaceomarginata]
MSGSTNRRAQDSFPAIGRGLSHGGGQIQPGELRNNISNTELTDELLADPSFQRLAALPIFSSPCGPPSSSHFTKRRWRSSSLGTPPCDGTSRGSTSDPDLGAHLILWDLRLVIRFPPGSTILIPSAIVRHSNVPIQAHERRSSFAQYTAAGLFRWVRNGFKTDEDFETSRRRRSRQSGRRSTGGRWEEGMKMFSVIDRPVDEL